MHSTVTSGHVHSSGGIVEDVTVDVEAAVVDVDVVVVIVIAETDNIIERVIEATTIMPKPVVVAFFSIDDMKGFLFVEYK